MSNFDLNLSLHLLYNKPVALSFDAFAKNEEMNSWTITKVSETENELVVKIDDDTATFTKVDKRIDFDYDAYRQLSNVLADVDFHIVRNEALEESKDHTCYIEVKTDAKKETAFLEIQALFIAAMYQTDEAKPVGVYQAENDLLLCFADFEGFGINQINDWGMYCAWLNFQGHEGKKKTTVYTKGIKKLGEKDLEISVKKGNVLDAYKFLFNLSLHCLSSTASYEDGHTTTAPNGKDYEFTKKKSKFVDSKVLELEKW